MRSLLALVLLAAVAGLPLSAQQKTPEVKPPALPPINPAAARLDQTITGLDGPGFAIAYRDAADRLVAGCERGTLQVWRKDVLLSIRSGSGTGNKVEAHAGPVVALAWQGGRILASAGSDRKIVLWNMTEGKPVHTIENADTQIKALAMSPDGKLLASAGESMTVHLWDVESGKPVAKLAEHKDWVLCLAFSPDGKQLASGDFAGAVRLWDVAGAKKLANLPAAPMPPPKMPPDPVPAQALAFAPDGKTLALGGADGVIHLINVADGKAIRALPGHQSSVTALAWHPTGTLLVSSSKDRTIRLWNPANAQALKTLEGHTAWVEGVTFTTDYTRLASVGADQTVRIWDLTDPPKK